MVVPAGRDTMKGHIGRALKYGVTGADRGFLSHWGYDDAPDGTNGSDGGPESG
jgi:hypothetical protein